jgi:hypothetical protein
MLERARAVGGVDCAALGVAKVVGSDVTWEAVELGSARGRRE